MKYQLLAVILLYSFSTLAQDTTVIYYDRNGKVCKEDAATKFALVVKETNAYKKLMVDGEDNKIEWTAYFTDAECKKHEGPYKSLYKNGKVKQAGYYHEEQKSGIWRSWFDNGKIADSFFFDNGILRGTAMQWDILGNVVDSIVYSENGVGESHSYWSAGVLRQKGFYHGEKKNGPWTYYYASGIKCQEVQYVEDSAISFVCYDQTGNLQKENCYYEKEAGFPGGDKKWIQYLTGKLSKAVLPDAYWKGRVFGTVWIQFVVNSDGSVVEAKIIASVDPDLDRVALEIIKASPRWDHAVQFNRPVKAYRKQPITFTKVSD